MPAVKISKARAGATSTRMLLRIGAGVMMPLMLAPRSLLSRRCLSKGFEQAAPAAVGIEKLMDVGRFLAQALELAMFELDARAALGRDESNLDFGDERRVEAELSVDLPREQK